MRVGKSILVCAKGLFNLIKAKKPRLQTSISANFPLYRLETNGRLFADRLDVTRMLLAGYMEATHR